MAQTKYPVTEWQSLRDEGLTYEKIADRHGVAIATVHYHLNKGRVWVAEPRSELGRRARSEAPRICEMYRSGMTLQKVADSLGYSKRLVHRIMREEGEPIRSHSGSNHHQWKGGRLVTDQGYVSVLISAEHPMACMRINSGRVLEHRLVMAEHLGRPLSPWETVHHVNGDKQDNRMENLQLRQGSHGAGVAYACRSCGSFDIVPTALSDVRAS